jgi:hypothetical protein
MRRLAQTTTPPAIASIITPIINHMTTPKAPVIMAFLLLLLPPVMLHVFGSPLPTRARAATASFHTFVAVPHDHSAANALILAGQPETLACIAEIGVPSPVTPPMLSFDGPVAADSSSQR